jgi:hypothetical protein
MPLARIELLTAATLVRTFDKVQGNNDFDLRRCRVLLYRLCCLYSPWLGPVIGQASYDYELPVIASLLAGIASGIAGFRSCFALTNRQGALRSDQAAGMSTLSWLFVGANVLISALAAFPSLLVYLSSSTSIPRLGGFATFVFLIAAMLQCEEGYIFGCFLLFFLCILLLLPRVPWKARLAASVWQLGASALLLRFTGQARARNPGCGLF